MHLVKVQHIFIGWRSTLCRADTVSHEKDEKDKKDARDMAQNISEPCRMKMQ